MNQFVDAFKAEAEHLKKSLDWEISGAFLAGGAITSTFTNRAIKDFDLYFKNRKTFEAGVESAYEDGMWCLSSTSRAITFKSKNEQLIQLMHFDWFDSAEKIFDRFDFTCCMAAMDLDTGILHRHPQFISDTCKRVLRFNHKTAFPLGSALRIRKYVDRGYTIDKDEYLKVLMAVAFRPLSNWDDLKDQIGGQYGDAVTMDTTAEFNLDNAIQSLNSTLLTTPTADTSSVPANADEALAKIFGVNKDGIKR